MEIGKNLLLINWIDVLILILLIRTGYVGFARGLTNGILPLIGTFAALVASLHYYDIVGGAISTYLPVKEIYTQYISYLFIGIGILMIARIFSVRMGGKENTIGGASFLDSLSGCILGCMRGILLVSYIAVALGITPVKYIQVSLKEKSLVGKAFESAGHTVYKKTVYVFSADE